LQIGAHMAESALHEHAVAALRDEHVAQGLAGIELLAALIEIGEREILRDLDAAGVGRQLADQQLDQRALAGAVGPDDADAVAAQDQRREILDQYAVTAFGGHALRDAGGIDDHAALRLTLFGLELQLAAPADE